MVNTVWVILEYVWASGCLREQFILRRGFGQACRAKMSRTTILTRSASEHDGEQVDSHCCGVKHGEGLQSIRHRIFLWGRGEEKKE